MNYEEMSDFEVNKAVSSLVYFGDLVVTVNDDNEVVYLCDKDGFFDMTPISHFDPCNNPPDAWPIIVDNKINLSFGLQHVTTKSFKESIQSATDKNPLRAAMICFLKMKDAENGKH